MKFAGFYERREKKRQKKKKTRLPGSSWKRPAKGHKKDEELGGQSVMKVGEGRKMQGGGRGTVIETCSVVGRRKTALARRSQTEMRKENNKDEGNPKKRKKEEEKGLEGKGVKRESDGTKKKTKRGRK